jgi:hypothetical protein
VTKLKRELEEVRKEQLIAEFANESREAGERREQKVVQSLNEEKERCKEYLEVVKKLKAEIDEIKVIV